MQLRSIEKYSQHQQTHVVLGNGSVGLAREGLTMFASAIVIPLRLAMQSRESA